MVPVYMLDVISTHHPLSRTIAHHLVCYPLPLAETRIHPGTIAAQDGIRGDKWLKHRLDRYGIQPFQLEVSQVACSVLYHHHRDVIRPCASGTAFAATMAGQAGQSALSFERLQEEGLIDLDDTLFPYRLVTGHGLQEAVTPQKGGVFTNPAAHCRLPDGQAVDEGLCIVFPALWLAKSGERRVGEHGAGAQALLAAITAQPARPAPGSQLCGLGLAVRATLAFGELSCQRGDGVRGGEFMLRETTLTQSEQWEEGQ
ncbi:hypothetical protein BA188_01980 [Aeromonas hydrophila]|nr:hypothetical protein BA189_13295 [Aeromonas hydrophila]OFC51737.1 hypothetical protein BA188_01980 [Aeromonas hydrophila]